MKLIFVSLDNPFPPNYGGAIDIYYKIKALSNLNCEIYLHCYYSDRSPHSELEQFCKEVYYYPRKSIIKTLISFNLPYLVASRNSKELLANLQKNDYPIFFDGLQSSVISKSPELKWRKKYLRIHNIESDYMANLSKSEKSILRKIVFKIECLKYLTFEKKLTHFKSIFTISNQDKNFYQKFNKNTFEVPPFHGNQSVQSLEGSGGFILYHGNFNVSENLKAVQFLIQNIFNNLDIPVKIAGINAVKKLSPFIENRNIELIENPSIQAMKSLVQSAHINILPTFQSTGVKLKLLNSLFLGRHCIVNNEMIAPTPFLATLCVICNSIEEYKRELLILFSTPFSYKEIQRRSQKLNDYCNNLDNANMILKKIFNE